MKKKIIIEGKIEIEEKPIENKNIRIYDVSMNNIAIDTFALDIKKQEIISPLTLPVSITLGIKEYNYNDYVEFLEKQGFEIMPKKVHWKPKKDETYYYHEIISDDTIFVTTNISYNAEQNLISNYLAFPTKELAEKCKDMSKLDRLQILYQYNNDMMFEPDWDCLEERKYFLFFSYRIKKVKTDFCLAHLSKVTFWQNQEDLEEFIQTYEKEILELMQ